LPEAIIVITQFPHEIKLINKQVRIIFNISTNSEFNFNELKKKFPLLKDPTFQAMAA